MAIKPGRKSFGGNTSGAGGGGGTPKTPNNKPKFLPKPATTPTPGSIKKAPPTPITVQSPPKKEMSPEKKPQPGISAQLNKVSDQSKGINKKNKQHFKKNKGNKPQGQGQGQGQQGKGKGHQHQNQKMGIKMSKKNRRQRFQMKLSAKARSPVSQSRAYKAEQELNKGSNRILIVKLPDPVITKEIIQGWSTNIENALFPKPVEPRSFSIVLKADADVKKEMDKLRKVSFGGGKLIVEDKKQHEAEVYKDKDGAKPEDFIDPYTLYISNLNESVNREDLQELFKDAKTVMNPRKHNPKVVGMGPMTKFAFVSFESAEAALDAFKMCFNKNFKGRAIIVRFRRVSKGELKKEEDEKMPQQNAAAKVKAEPPAKMQKKEEVKKGKPIKQEPEEDLDEDDDDDEEDDDEMGMEVEDEEESDEDDDEEMDDNDDNEAEDDDEDDGLDDDDDDDDDDEDDSE